MKPRRTRKITAPVSAAESKRMTEWLRKREGRYVSEFTRRKKP